jgi:hypothetical protein
MNVVIKYHLACEKKWIFFVNNMKVGAFKVIIKLKKGEEFVWFSCPFFELKGRRFT